MPKTIYNITIIKPVLTYPCPLCVRQSITYPKIEAPETARIFETIICEKCQEGTPEHKIRLMDGKKLCLDCYEPYTRGWN